MTFDGATKNPMQQAVRDALIAFIAAAHELADGVAHVRVVPAEPIDPAHDERVAGPEEIEQPSTLRALGEARAETGNAVVRDHVIDLEPRRLRLGPLMLERLLGGAHSCVENRGHAPFPCP